MEKRFPGPKNPVLQVILRKYRDSSLDSISGPHQLDCEIYPALSQPRRRAKSASRNNVQTKYHLSQHRDITKQTAITTMKLKETYLDGNLLVCFNIGGEKRLCYNQFVSEVLKDFSIHEVNRVKDQLQIYCPRTQPDQLEALKLAGIIPWSTASTSLITKSDAYRLNGVLFVNKAPKRSSRIFSKECFEVYHECFGGSVGTLEPGLYGNVNSKCLTCNECLGVFSPRKFVTHYHTSGEVHTCHWGFDSSNWRLYIMLCNENPSEKLQKFWEDIKNRFDTTHHKRSADRQESSADNQEERDLKPTRDGSPLPKRAARSPSSCSSSGSEREMCVKEGGSDIICRRSAFRPWSPQSLRAKCLEEQQKNAQSPFSHAPAMTIHSHPAISVLRANPMAVPPTRIFAPTGIPLLSSNCNCSGHVTYGGYPYACVTRECKSSHPAVSAQSLDEIATPTSNDPKSLEKTAKSMMDVVADNEKWFGVKEEDDERDEEVKSGAVITSENVEQILQKYNTENGLPNIRELSNSLAKELECYTLEQDLKVKELLKANKKLQEQIHFVRNDHEQKLKEAFKSLEDCQRDLSLLQAQHERDLTDFSRSKREFQQEIESYKKCRADNLFTDTRDTIIKLKQEVKELKSKLLEQEHNMCHTIQQKENNSVVPQWQLKSSRKYQQNLVYSDTFPRGEREAHFRDSLTNGHGKRTGKKSNGAVGKESSDEET